MDEVGLIIKYIEENGFLRFDTVGGIEPEVLAGKRVFIGDQMIPALVGIKAIHQQKAGERTKAVQVDRLYLDIGAKSAEEAQKVVAPGDRVVFAHNYAEFGDGLVRAKALDNRVGCAILLELLRQEAAYDFDAAFTVQEETGCIGGKTAAFAVQPDIALVLETTTAADLPENSGAKAVCRLGQGAALSFMDRGTVYDSGLYRLALRLAAEKGIPVQSKSLVSGGNESRSVQTAGAGARTLAVSVPCRYLHTQAVVMAQKDAESMLELVRDLTDASAVL